jgi:chloramphenicol-sensitive protein RarD
LLYIWGVNSGRILETSLGYYMNPLINVVVGYTFFSERLRRFQKLAILLAVAGVLNLTFGYGRFPWMGLSLAASFALYGALRKTARVDALPGQWIETLVLCVPASFYLLRLHWGGSGSFNSAQPSVCLLLAASGVITSLPLVGFAYGVRRLSFATVGVLQYISPTIAFLLGVFLYREPFTRSHLVTFCCIWLGILAYTLEGVWATRRLPPPQVL